MIYGFEKFVACEPPEDREIEVKTQGTTRKFNYMVSKNLLVPLKVVYGNADARLIPGDYVYVKHADIASNLEWTRPIEVAVPGADKPVSVVVVPLGAVYLRQSGNA